MAHIHEHIDFVVTILIVYDRKVLLVFHKEQQKWLPIGGHVELDEDPEQALFREVKEECGLDIEVITEKPTSNTKRQKFLLPPSYLDIHRINATHEHIGMVYFAKAKSDQVHLAKEEHDDIRWFTEEDLENPDLSVPKEIVFYAKEALKKTSN